MKTSLRRLKVLRLEYWQEELDFLDVVVTKLHRLPYGIYRDGWYSLHGYSWFVRRRKAYTTARLHLSFQNVLEFFEAEKYNAAQINALSNLRRQRMATKGQIRLLNLLERYLEVRNTGRQTFKHMLTLEKTYSKI